MIICKKDRSFVNRLKVGLNISDSGGSGAAGGKQGSGLLGAVRLVPGRHGGEATEPAHRRHQHSHLPGADQRDSQGGRRGWTYLDFVNIQYMPKDGRSVEIFCFPFNSQKVLRHYFFPNHRFNPDPWFLNVRVKSGSVEKPNGS